jgi:hypothetical protein
MGLKIDQMNSRGLRAGGRNKSMGHAYMAPKKIENKTMYRFAARDTGGPLEVFEMRKHSLGSKRGEQHYTPNMKY